MTIYDWATNTGGSFNFDDPHNWFNESSNKANDGVPGGGDTAQFSGSDTLVIATGGAGLAALTVFEDVTFNGDLAVSGMIEGGSFDSGTVTAGSVMYSDFEGANLTAGTVTGATLDGGTVQADLLAGASTIDGASVTVTAIKEGAIDVLGGTLTVGSLAFDVTTAGTFDSLEVGGETGSATTRITGDASISGNSEISCNVGGTLKFDKTLTIANGAAFTGYSAGHTTVADLVVNNAGQSGVGGIVLNDRTVLTVTRDLTLGDTSGEADLTVATGATLIVDGAFDMAEKAGSTGVATIGDAGVSMTVHGEWRIGVGGTATATIDQGISVSALGGITLGVKANSSGTLTVTDSKTVLTIGNADVTIGQAGAGTLTVQNSAIVDAGASDVTVADEAKSTGSLNALDSGAFEAGTLTVGGSGTGTLYDGVGRVVVKSDFSVGDAASGVGTATINGTGSKLIVSGDTTLGSHGKGTLTDAGGIIVLGAGAVTLGEVAKSKGILTMNGGSLSAAGTIVIGAAGSGTALFNQSAKLLAGSGNKAADLTLGEKVGGTGSLTLDGKGTTATVKDLTDGELGKGTVALKNGAVLTAATASLAGQASTNANGVTIDTAARMTVKGDFSVGDHGVGTLTVKSAGQAVGLGDVSIGAEAASIGSATITGAVTNASTKKTTASGLGFSGILAVGDGGSGGLTISKGALVAPTSGGKGVVEIGAEDDSTGKITLTDAGSALQGKTLAVGGTATAAGGTGRLAVSSGAVVSFTSAAVWKSGTVVLSGGTLTLTGGLTGDGTVTIGSGGTLSLGGADKTVGITFSSGATETLQLRTPGLVTPAIKGFGKGDSIALGGLDSKATFSVKIVGANTAVTFTDGGKSAGRVTLAGHYAASALHLDTTTDTLTTTGATAPAAAPFAALSGLGTLAQVTPFGTGRDAFALGTYTNPLIPPRASLDMPSHETGAGSGAGLTAIEALLCVPASHATLF